MSIPVKGISVLYAKLASILTFLVATLFEVNFFGDLLYYLNSGTRKMHLFTHGDVMIIDLFFMLLYFIIIAVAVILMFFSYMVCRIAGRFSKVFAGITLFASSWLFIRGSFLLSGLIEFTGIPDVRIFMTHINQTVNQQELRYVYANPAPIIASLVFAGLYFVISAVIYDRVVEA